MHAHDRYLLGSVGRCRYCGGKEYASEPCPCSDDWACPKCESTSHSPVSQVEDPDIIVECFDCDHQYNPLEDDDDAPAVD